MNLNFKEYKKKYYKDKPPIPTKFKIGDKVTFTNDYGVKFYGETITGFSETVEGVNRFIYIHNGRHEDAYWFPNSPDQLTLEK